MPHEIFAQVKKWETLRVVMLRNMLQREIRRRLDCVIIGRPHTEEEIRAHDEKTEAHQALSRSGLERETMEMAPADQDALREAEEPKEGA